MKYILLILLSILNSNAYSETTSVPCPYNDSTTDSGVDKLLGCNSAVIAFRADPDEERNYRKKINLKLAKLVATQTQQILQDLGATSSFYEDEGNDFFVSGNGGNVQKSCQFSFIKNLEAKGCPNKNGLEEKEKIKMLTEALSNGSKEKSLWDSVMHTYGTSKIGYKGLGSDIKQCPLKESLLPLATQITKNSADRIINQIQNENDHNTINKLYEYYPQLAMIEEANKTDPGFKFKFEKYIRSFNSLTSTPSNSRAYLAAFFFDKKNQETLSKGVAHRCDQMQSSISRFICQPMDRITADNKEISKKLFNFYDPSKDFEHQRAAVREDPEAFKTFALRCEEAAKLKRIGGSVAKVNSNDKCVNYKEQEQSLDNFYSCFEQGIRPQSNAKTDSDNLKGFCDRYSCKTQDVKDLKSCLAGGPLKFSEINLSTVTDPDIFQEVAFMEKLESKRVNLAQMSANIKDSPTSDLGSTKKKLNLSAFDLNAFGADAVMKLEHIPVTTETTSIVAQEMKEKGIEPAMPSARESHQPEKQAQGENTTPNTAQVQVPSTSYVPQPNSNEHSHSSNAATGDAPIATSTTVKKSDAPFSSGDTSSHKPSSENQNQLDSVQQMVSDLGKIMNSEKLKPSSLGEVKSIPYIDPSLESWARNLAAKETALRNREAYADQKDAELWRRESDLHSAESRTSATGGGSTGIPEKLGAGIKDDGPKSALKIKQDAIAETNASPTGLTLTPDKLSQMDKAGLKELGVNINEPFIISIKLNGKLIHVRVSKITANGKTFLAPNLNDDNFEVKEVVLKSPVFKDFRQYYQQLSSNLTRHTRAM